LLLLLLWDQLFGVKQWLRNNSVVVVSLLVVWWIVA